MYQSGGADCWCVWVNISDRESTVNPFEIFKIVLENKESRQPILEQLLLHIIYGYPKIV